MSTDANTSLRNERTELIARIDEVLRTSKYITDEQKGLLLRIKEELQRLVALPQA